MVAAFSSITILKWFLEIPPNSSWILLFEFLPAVISFSKRSKRVPLRSPPTMRRAGGEFFASVSALPSADLMSFRTIVESSTLIPLSEQYWSYWFKFGLYRITWLMENKEDRTFLEIGKFHADSGDLPQVYSLPNRVFAMIIIMTSFVPAPISLSLLSLKNLSTGNSLL